MDDTNGKLHTVTPAIPELGYTKADDNLPIPNRFADVREVNNLVRYATYQVENLAAIIAEDIAEGQAAAAVLERTAMRLVSSLEALKAASSRDT